MKKKAKKFLSDLSSLLIGVELQESTPKLSPQEEEEKTAVIIQGLDMEAHIKSMVAIHKDKLGFLKDVLKDGYKALYRIRVETGLNDIYHYFSNEEELGGDWILFPSFREGLDYLENRMKEMGMHDRHCDHHAYWCDRLADNEDFELSPSARVIYKGRPAYQLYTNEEGNKLTLLFDEDDYRDRAVVDVEPIIYNTYDSTGWEPTTRYSDHYTGMWDKD